MAAPTVTDHYQGSDPQDRRYHIIVLGPDGSVPVTLPERGVALVGRDEDADVRIVDQFASRQHARLYIGEHLEIEDLGSQNGTKLRNEMLPPLKRVSLHPGDAIVVGDTVMLVQRIRPGLEVRRLWAHGYLETRLIEECARAQSRKTSFALARIHIATQTPALKVERLIADTLRSGDVLAGYGPNEYEVLLVDSEESRSKALGEAIMAALAEQKIAGDCALAFYPSDGTSPQTLVTCACDRLRAGGASEGAREDVVLESRQMRELYALAGRAAAGTINVLIVGETGVGKEVLAETVHRLSPRADKPFLPLNCAALSEALVESELFGFERGAFTGAVQAKVGLLEAAAGGTLFLDEVGEMSASVQAKLLRAIETHQVLRIGATKPRPIDVRFLAATNRDLEEEVAEHRFREDLFFRLNGIKLEIPPLRERPEEIELFARRFLEKAAAQAPGRPIPTLSPESLELLRAYPWPGNIRELRNVVERALLLCMGTTITPEHLPADKMRKAARQLSAAEEHRDPTPAAAPPSFDTLPRDPKGLERQAIVEALERCFWNQTRAAELLNMPRRTFCKRLTEYSIPRPRG